MVDPDGGVRGLTEEVERYPWYHTMELGDAITPGMFDHRRSTDRYLIPDDLSGMRCLDVGTMDGFWAFEMERRGAEHVVAIDLDDPEVLDWPASLRHKVTKTLDETKGIRFELARRALGSKVERQLLSVYDLTPDMGAFDLVFCGDLLVHLKDPITAIERIRSVCRDKAIVCTPIVRLRLARRRPLAKLDGIDEFQWWVFTMPALERLMLAAGFARIDATTTLEMPARAGGAWKGLRGVVLASV